MFENLIEELRQVMRFKESTEAGDLVLVAADNPQVFVYGLVTGIEPDTSRQGGWWHVSIHLLTVPPQAVVWTLRKPQFTGSEVFTMGGDKRFVQAVDLEGQADFQEHEQGHEQPFHSPSAEIKPFKRVK